MKGIKNLIKWIKPVFILFIIICTFQVVIPLTYSFVPQFIKYVFDYIIDNTNASNTLPQFIKDFFGQYSGVKAALVVGIVLAIYQALRASLMFLNSFIKGIFTEKIALNIRTKMYEHIQDLPLSYHNNVDSGDLIQRCTSDIDTIRGFICNQLPEILYIFASIISGALQMGAVNKGITLVTMIILPISLITSAIYFKYISKKFEEVEEVEAKMTSTIEENVNGVRVVKAFNQEKEEIDNFLKKSGNYRDKSKKINKAMATFWGLSDGSTFLQYSITIGYCIYLAKNNLIGTGDIVVCVMYISMLVYPIRSLGRIIGDFGKAIVASNRVDEILSIEDEYVINGKEKPVVTGNISFNDVHFKFGDSDTELFKGLTFDIKSGETVAFIGKTGSGKSTIASILVRMMEYDSGSILIDGVELKDIDKHHIRENVGIILQDPFLYSKSISENIKIGNKELSDTDVKKAAKIASVDKDITSFDLGYDTQVGEKGVTLSGGQKQRIAIARMLILDKPVMIFDDSLSAVDTKTDLEIRNSLKKDNETLTSIIITHRITSAKEADKIIVIEDGKVSEIGTHEELANKEGLYKSLWDIQGALEDEFTNLLNKEVNE